MRRLLAKTFAAMALLGGFTSLRAEFGYVPVNWMTTSSWRKVMFKMVAPQWEGKRSDGVIARQPFGVAYEINADGELKELWRTQGWHCPQAYISDDGRYLVRMGEPATDKENHTDLAVAFYDRGVPVLVDAKGERVTKP